MKKSISSIIKEEIDKYLRKNIIREYLDNDYGLPLYRTAKKEFGDAEVVKTTWLVHTFSASDEVLAKEIMHNGFSNGLSKDELNRYSMTWAKGKHEDKGYSWAYRADKFLKKRWRKIDYGTSILFQASGIEYFNPEDYNKQVIFYNKSAKNLILIYAWDGEENKKDKFSTYHEKENIYAVGNVNGKPLYIGYFGDVIEWCITNFNQYRKNLLVNDTILHVSDKTDIEYEDYLDKNGYGELPKDANNKYTKWHSWDEEKDDLEHWRSIIKAAYEDYLTKNWNEEAERERIINHFKENGKPIPDDETINKVLDILKPSYGDFITKYQKEHKFYHRRRPDGAYWVK